MLDGGFETMLLQETSHAFLHGLDLGVFSNLSESARFSERLLEVGDEGLRDLL